METYKRNLILFILIVNSIGLYAFGVQDHVKDMRRIFPFDIYSPQNKKIRDFYYMVNAAIDYNDFPSINHQTGHPLCIKNDSVFSKMIFANHRIWFHWGFNTNPQNFSLLKNMVKNNIDNGIIKETDLNRFWSIIKNEVKKRNKYLMEEWAKILGYSGLSGISSTQRAQARAFVTILYSIHILGDHQTSEISVLADRKSIYGDIYNAIDDLAGKALNNREKAKSFKNKLRRVQGNPKLFLDKMEKEFNWCYTISKLVSYA